MPPPRKKAKTTASDDKLAPSPLLSDCRAKWLVKNDKQSVELNVKGEVLVVHKDILTTNCEYFETCLNHRSWTESYSRCITFDDIESKYLALFIGVAYSHSSIVPMSPPQCAKNPEAGTRRTPLRDFVEVLKLCDRFVAAKMGDYIAKCINVAIGDGHKALFRSQHDEEQQRKIMQDFADGYEALDMMQTLQEGLGKNMIEYFCNGVNFQVWKDHAGDVKDRPEFMQAVSMNWAGKLGELVSLRKLKRKEVSGPHS